MHTHPPPPPSIRHDDVPGKVMPIQRGGGVDQKLLQDFARRVAAGDWAHVFPEGRVAQTGKLEGRRWIGGRWCSIRRLDVVLGW